MRLTRAAQRAQEDPKSTSSEPIEATKGADRAALHDISPNASPEQLPSVQDPPPKTPAKTPAKKGKAKGGAKKGVKGKKTKKVEAQQKDEKEKEGGGEDDDEEPPQQSVQQECDAAVDDGFIDDAIQTPLNDKNLTIPPTHSVRLTRRQMAALHEEKSKMSQPTFPPDQISTVTAPTDERDVMAQENRHEDVSSHEHDPISVDEDEPAEPRKTIMTCNAEQAEKAVESKVQEPTCVVPSVENETHCSNTIAPSVEIVDEPQSPQSDATTDSQTLVANQSKEQSMSPESQTSNRRRVSRSPSKSPMRIEESLEAIDALEEALDSLDAVTSFNHPIDEKSPRKKILSKCTEKPAARARTPSNTLRTAPSQTVIRATKLSKVPSAFPTDMKSTKTSLARVSSVRAASTKEAGTGSTETVDYLASKRRPVSLSFPTPPPPPKGRAPTKSTFQLSSDGIVAKLKAQKEERAKREAEGVALKRRPISIAPQPKSSKPLTKPTFQLPGEKTAEKLRTQKEERLKKQAEAPRKSLARPLSVSMPSAPPKSTKPATKPTKFQLPGAAVAEKLKAQKEERLKRQEEAEAANKAAASRARIVPIRKPVKLPMQSTPGVTIPPTSQAPAQRPTSITKKRSSIMPSQSHSTLASSATRTATATGTSSAIKTSVLPTDPTTHSVRSKELSNRDKVDREANERERTERENAAKKARAEAAERGRIASREWAEKQRKKMMMKAA